LKRLLLRLWWNSEIYKSMLIAVTNSTNKHPNHNQINLSYE
jgi:hypothetical protein